GQVATRRTCRNDARARFRWKREFDRGVPLGARIQLTGMGRETATLIAGLAAAAVLPLLALGLGFPLWLSAVIAAGVFAGAWYLLRSGGRAGLDDEDLLAARSETARGLIDDAATSLDRLKK